MGLAETPIRRISDFSRMHLLADLPEGFSALESDYEMHVHNIDGKYVVPMGSKKSPDGGLTWSRFDNECGTLDLMKNTASAILNVADGSNNLMTVKTGSAYFKDKVGIGTDSPFYKLHIEDDVNDGVRCVVKNENGGSSAYGAFGARSDSCWLYAYAYSSTFIGTAYGQSRSDAIEISAHSSSSFLIGTRNISPLIFGTNNIERMRMGLYDITIGSDTSPEDLLLTGYLYLKQAYGAFGLHIITDNLLTHPIFVEHSDSINPLFTVRGNGHVGIGVDQATYQLHVYGENPDIVAHSVDANEGSYVGLFKGQGSLPGYPSAYRPVLKTDHSYIYFSTNTGGFPYYTGAIFSDGSGHGGLRINDSASNAKISLRTGDDSYIASDKNFAFNMTSLRAWNSAWRAVQFGPLYNIMYSPNAADTTSYMMHNIYNDGSWKRAANAGAILHAYSSGSGFVWYIDAAGTPDVSFTPTVRMQLALDGSLTVNNYIRGTNYVEAYNATGQGTYLRLDKSQGSLPGYSTHYYPVLKTDNAFLYFSVNNKYTAYLLDNGTDVKVFGLRSSDGLSDVVRLNTNGDSYLNGGFVGINKTAASYNEKVGIQSSLSSQWHVLAYNDSGELNGGLYNDGGAGALYLYPGGAGGLKVLIRSNGDSYLNGGNVGIGKTDPDYKLHIEDDVNTGLICVANNENSDSAAYSAFGVWSDSCWLYVYAFSSTNSGTRYGQSRADANEISSFSSSKFLIGTYSYAPIIFGTHNTERMRIQANGDVGIGTNDPDHKLHIKDSVNDQVGFAMQNTNTGSNAFAYLGVGSHSCALYVNAYSASYPGVLHGITRADGVFIRAGFSANFVLGTDDAAPLFFTTNGAERMGISSTGHVNIKESVNLDVQAVTLTNANTNVTPSKSYIEFTHANFTTKNVDLQSGSLGTGTILVISNPININYAPVDVTAGATIVRLFPDECGIFVKTSGGQWVAHAEG